jgi:hypothetical protein
MVSDCVCQRWENCETKAHEVSGFGEGEECSVGGQCPFSGAQWWMLKTRLLGQARGRRLKRNSRHDKHWRVEEGTGQK